MDANIYKLKFEAPLLLVWLKEASRRQFPLLGTYLHLTTLAVDYLKVLFELTDGHP